MNKSMISLAIAAALITGCASNVPETSDPEFGWSPIVKDSDGDYYTFLRTWHGDSHQRLGFYAMPAEQCSIGATYMYGEESDGMASGTNTLDGVLKIQIGDESPWSVEREFKTSVKNGYFALSTGFIVPDGFLGELFNNEDIQLGIVWPDGDSTPIYRFIATDSAAQFNNLLTMCETETQKVVY